MATGDTQWKPEHLVDHPLPVQADDQHGQTYSEQQEHDEDDHR